MSPEVLEVKLADMREKVMLDVKEEVDGGVERAETRFGILLNEQMTKVNTILQLEPELKSLKTEVEQLLDRANILANTLEGRVDRANDNVVKSLDAQKKYLEDLLMSIEALLDEMTPETG
ncbi:hypothetical protein ACFL4G_06145 [Thermodesulfobacteriota bacterium]